MMKKVAVVAVAQIGHPESVFKNITELTYEACKKVLGQGGMKREELDTVVTSSADYWQGISCSSCFYYESMGAYLKNATKVEGCSLSAFIYAVMRIMSGHFDTALVHAITKSSEVPNESTLTNLCADPFYQRPLGLDDISTAAMQARLYMDRYQVTEQQAAKVVVKNLGNGISNPHVNRRGPVTVEEVLTSEPIAHPIKLLDWAAKDSDGSCALILASEERAKELTQNPVWVKGMGWSTDSYFLGDRDLLDTPLRRVGQRAYEMAGITKPIEEIDVAELCEPSSFQELLWYEHLGFCGQGEGGDLVDSGVTAMNGSLPVNPSGGVLSFNPHVARGLFRIVEAVLQLRGEAEKRQVPGAETALAHSTHGFAGQNHSVVILGKS